MTTPTGTIKQVADFFKTGDPEKDKVNVPLPMPSRICCFSASDSSFHSALNADSY